MPNKLGASSHIYLTGGHDGLGELNDVWIYNTILNAGNSSWTEGPKMNKKRNGHGCIVVHHEQKSLIVVADSDYTNAAKSVEILDPNQNKWVQGENTKKHHFLFFWNTYLIIHK